MADDEITGAVQVPDMCVKHQGLLLAQIGVGPAGPWRASIVIAQITLFQAATALEATYERIGGDVRRLSELGCLACYRPDAFGEVVQAFQTGGMSAVKALGEQYVKNAS
jgi:hypothetical protein